MGIFEAQPVVGKRIVTLNIQIESDAIVSIVITGTTWSFRSRLDAFGVEGGYVSEPGQEENRKYLWLLKQLDLSQESSTQRVMELVGDAVFNNLAMRVVLDKEPNADTHVAEFVEKLKSCSSLHFDRPVPPSS